MAAEMVQFYLMGKPHAVPKGLTIQKAMEYSGFRLLRGCGCRGGFCGACGTVYRTAGDYKLKVGLACQTVVEDQMYLALIPFFPAVKASYDIEDLPATAETIISLYPEVLRCVGCNSCRKVCPQEIEVMRYIAAAQRGDIARVADLSFDCLMCGLCASRCPAEIVQYNVAILARRLYSRHIAKPAKHLDLRVAEIDRGECDVDLAGMMAASDADLKKMYAARVIEPEEL